MSAKAPAESELVTAARKCDFETALILLEHGADPRAHSVEGWTALHCAAVMGNQEVARALLERGADPNAQAWETEASFDAPLHFAAGNGRVEIVRLLIEFGADVNLADKSHKTPLRIAALRVERGHKASESAEIMRLLTQAGGY